MSANTIDRGTPNLDDIPLTGHFAINPYMMGFFAKPSDFQRTHFSVEIARLCKFRITQKI